MKHSVTVLSIVAAIGLVGSLTAQPAATPEVDMNHWRVQKLILHP